MQLPAPTGVQARYYGPYNSINDTQYFYWVQALYPEGYSQLSAAGSTSAHCPAALSGSGFNAVQWNSAPGAIGYLVWRTLSATAPGSGASLIFIATSETGVKDDGTLTIQTATPRFDGIFTAKMIWDFTTDGGADATQIIPSVSDLVPANAIFIGGVAIVDVTIVGPTAWEVGTSAGSSATSLLAAGSALTAGTIVKLVPNTTPFQMSAAGQLTIEFTVANATAGRVEVNATYLIPSNPS